MTIRPAVDFATLDVVLVVLATDAAVGGADAA